MRPVALEQADRNGNVVEDAEAFAMCGEGVVGAAGEVHRDAVLRRVSCGFYRAARRAIGPLDQRFRPREAELANFVMRKLAAA